MRVQAFVVRAAGPEVEDAFILVQRRLNTAAGIFTKHQVLAIETGKCLLVFAFHRGLYRRFEGVFNFVDQLDNGKHLESGCQPEA